MRTTLFAKHLYNNVQVLVQALFSRSCMHRTCLREANFLCHQLQSHSPTMRTVSTARENLWLNENVKHEEHISILEAQVLSF